VVHRSDGSGTTFIFTNYLAKVSAEWERQGRQCPFGVMARPRAGSGRKGQRRRRLFRASGSRGAVGYIEYAYAKQNKMTYTLLQNRDGNFRLGPNDKSFQSGGPAGADWKNAPGFYEILTDEPGKKQAGPSTGATFILMHKMAGRPGKSQRGPQILRVGLQGRRRDGPRRLDYISHGPTDVVALVQSALERARSRNSSGQEHLVGCRALRRPERLE